MYTKRDLPRGRGEPIKGVAVLDVNAIHKIRINMGFLKLVVFAVFAVVLIALGSASPTVQPLQDGYVETGQCEVTGVALITMRAIHFGLVYGMERHMVIIRSYYYVLVLFQDNNVCMYTYNVSQQFFQGDALQNYTLSAVVRVDCYSGKQQIYSSIIMYSYIL